MHYLISLIVVFVAFVVAVFALSNILFPIIYSIPRLKREKRNNNLIKNVPVLKQVWAPLTWTIILTLAFYFSSTQFPNHKIELFLGVGLALFSTLRQIDKNGSDTDEDFKRTYREYLKDINYENSVSQLKIFQEKFDGKKEFNPSDFYVQYDKLRNMELRAFEKYTIKDYRSAIAICDNILDLNPEIVTTLTLRAGCLENLNYNLEAIADYAASIKIDDTDANIYGLLGLLFHKIGEFDKGQKMLETAVKLGMKMYEPQWKMFEMISSNPDSKERMIKEAKVPANLGTRNKKDFEDDLSEIDRKEFNNNFMKSIEGIKFALALDPKNEELTNLLNFIKSKLN